MGTQSHHHQRPSPAWPQGEEGSEINTGYEHASCLDEASLKVVLLEAILELSAETRRKLLMFMHQADDLERVLAEMRAEADGRLELRLSYQDH